jgi:hypothetical protein
MTIDPAGNVGIGIATPEAGLDVRPTLTATADNQALVGLRVAPNFQNNEKTGIRQCSLEVSGLLQTDQFQVKTKSFKVDGDFDKFYPIVFGDHAWHDGALELEICRSQVHIDSEWRGALISKFICHSTNWGHGADFTRAEIHQSQKVFVASYRNIFRTAKLIVWLRGGGTTYYWRSNHPAALLDAQAAAKNIDTEALDVKTAIDAGLDGWHVEKKSW